MRRDSHRNLGSQTVHRVSSRDHGIDAWLVVDSLAGGIAFGGTRFRAGTTETEVSELARCMTWKLGGHEAPTGGAKAGFSCGPDHPGLPDFLKLFAQTLRTQLQTQVVLGKDLGASDFLLDTLYRHVGSPQLASAQAQQPGAPLPDQVRQLTGYRRHMTGLGLSFSVTETLGDSLAGCRVVVQGFGAVGAGSAARLSAQGATIVGVSDVDGSLLNPRGLPLTALLAASNSAGILNPTRVRQLGVRGPTEALLRCEADLLVLAAASHSVDRQLAEQIQAPLVAEGANFGLTEGARELLHQRGIVVLPDIIANSAAAAMACRQIGGGNRLDDKSLWTAIEESIRSSTRDATWIAQSRGCTIRNAWIDHLEGPTT